MIIGGVIGTIVFRLFLFPLPGGDHPPTKDDLLPDTKILTYNQFSHWLSRSVTGPSFRNVDCGSAVGGDQSFCTHEWCSDQPAVNIWQYVIGTCFVAITNAFCQGLVQTLFNKMLGPKPQVHRKKIIKSIW